MKPRRGQVRVIGGRWRGRKLPVVDAPGLRPMPERSRETLFNWLGHRVIDSHCLDLFAGSGALGIEALSRGAARAVFVESLRGNAGQLLATLRGLDAGGAENDPWKLLHASAPDCLREPGHWRDCPPFDIVFADPPFAAPAELLGECAAALQGAGLLSEAALLAIGTPRRRVRESVACLGEPWVGVRAAHAGKSALTLLKRTAP